MTFKQEIELQYGIKFPEAINDTFLMLILWKKWREFEERDGITFRDPWEYFLRAARVLFTKEQFAISPWTEQHAYDWTMHDKVITIGCASSSKSNDTALLALLDWCVDPTETVTLIGSTTKVDLASRSWASLINYHQHLRTNAHGFLVPGKVSKVGYKLVNETDDETAGSASERVGIHGRALDEDGRLAGAHAPYVRLIVDELAEIKNHDPIKVALANLSIGARNFKFIGLANPESWENPSSQIYCIPETGIESVTVDTGAWMSTFGAKIRHHDGLKSPTIINPALRKEFPYLISQSQIDEIIKMEGGNTDSPRIWKMVRGFFMAKANTIPTVLEPGYIQSSRCKEPSQASLTGQPVHHYASVAGCDPAWSEGGDGAIYQQASVLSVDGFPIIDFGGSSLRLMIQASSDLTVTQQLRDQVLTQLRLPRAPDITNVAVDASGNQGLGDALDIYVGQGSLHVNNSQRASEVPLRSGSSTPAKEYVFDRGTESWFVLAEFIKAGMVRGLPEDAAQALVSRRLCLRPKTTTVVTPFRMESKEEFRKRFKGSPDVADACALAALVVKERLGIMPFMTHFPKRLTDSVAPSSPAQFGAIDEQLQELVPIVEFSSSYGGDPFDTLDTYGGEHAF